MVVPSFFSPNSVFTEGFLRSEFRPGARSRCPACASILRGTYRRIAMLYDVEDRFDCAGSHKMRRASKHLAWYLPLHRDVVRCRSAFRLRRLAQNEARECGRELFAWFFPEPRDVV